MDWALKCILHLKPLLGDIIDYRLENAFDVAKSWKDGKASVGDARNAAFAAIEVAKEVTNPTHVAIARGIGHTVATAHMADHAPEAAEYALKAIAIEGKSINTERKWQDDQLPLEIKKLVLDSRLKKSKFWKSHMQKARKKP
jgi:hypothetical protein